MGEGSELERALTNLLESELEPEFARLGYLADYGTLALELDLPDVEITIDGALVGKTRPGRTVIGGLKPRNHSVAIVHPALLPAEVVVTIERGRATLHTPVVIPAPTGSAGSQETRWLSAGSHSLWAQVLRAAKPRSTEPAPHATKAMLRRRRVCCWCRRAQE